MIDTFDAGGGTWTAADGTAHTGRVVCRDQDATVLDCVDCGFVHVTPLPTPEALEAFYAEEFYGKEKPTYLEDSRRDAEWIGLGLSERIDRIEELLGRSGGRMLDVGSGPGSFLVAGTERGWEMTGIEPSVQASAFSRERGSHVIRGTFTRERVQGLEPFDVVHLSKVLEHISDPRALIEIAGSLLVPGGLLVIAVPNDFNDFQESYVAASGRPRWWVVPGHHLNYFSFDSLEKLMASAGLEPVQRDTDFPMELFLLMGDHYVGDGPLGGALHLKRKAFDSALAQHGRGQVKKRFYAALAQAGLGRTAVVFGRKSTTD